jgi:alkylation response protein AidB-like acyl-CoA dehydrogenase
MFPRISPRELTTLYEKARKEPLSDALRAMGEAVSGVAGFLVCNRFVIHDRAAIGLVVGADGKAIAPTGLVDYPDPVLDHLGLSVGQTTANDAAGPNVSVAALAIRLGILSRMLDMAYAHLKNRVSFGQKTLSHQLVKAAFADVHGAVVRLNEQMRLRARESIWVGLRDDHCEVTESSGKAEKLMGGHGYLLTGTHSLSYVSTMLFSVYGATEC